MIIKIFLNLHTITKSVLLDFGVPPLSCAALCLTKGVGHVYQNKIGIYNTACHYHIKDYYYIRSGSCTQLYEGRFCERLARK